MFEISWSEILVIGVVALIVVGPKELPVLLRTVGKYMGIIKRQAAEFRAQFDEAMRESELDQIRKDVESIRNDAEATIRDASRSVESHMDEARREFDTVTDSVKLDHQSADATTGSAAAEAALASEVASHVETSAADAAVSPAGAAAIAAADAAAAPREPIKTGA